MDIDNTDLLSVLKTELTFIEMGGYQHAARAKWRPHFMFQDSPTCLNFDPTEPPRPCGDCVLTNLVPEDARKKKFPCRYIPLNDRGETIDYFYRSETEEGLETAVKNWLKTRIAQLEREREEASRASERPQIEVKANFVGGQGN